MMGDYADDTIDIGLSRWDYEYEGAFDEDRFDDEDYTLTAPHRRAEPLPKKCYRCGAGNLYWMSTGKGWRLFDFEKNRQHKCRPFKPVSEDVTF